MNHTKCHDLRRVTPLKSTNLICLPASTTVGGRFVAAGLSRCVVGVGRRVVGDDVSIDLGAFVTATAVFVKKVVVATVSESVTNSRPVVSIVLGITDRPDTSTPSVERVTGRCFVQIDKANCLPNELRVVHELIGQEIVMNMMRQTGGIRLD